MAHARTIRISRRGAHRGHRSASAFTLIDLMIVIIIMGILAALVFPRFANYSADSAQTAAESNLDSVKKALDMYWMANKTYPSSLEALQFQASEALVMPNGWELSYDPMTGEVALVETGP